MADMIYPNYLDIHQLNPAFAEALILLTHALPKFRTHLCRRTSQFVTRFLTSRGFHVRTVHAEADHAFNVVTINGERYLLDLSAWQFDFLRFPLVVFGTFDAVEAKYGKHDFWHQGED
jgi:hypothetical protein